MSIKIVADSGCELNEQLKSDINITQVPLNLTLGDKQYKDDGTLDIVKFLNDMKISPVAPKSSSPSSIEFINKFEGEDDVFVVTMSSKISSTYNSAVIAKDMFLEQFGNKFIHVFDSLTASVGETLVALKVDELAKNNFKNNEIVNKVNDYINGMKTYFLLDSLDHLIKSGRINRFKGALASIMSIKPIMGKTPEGSIDLVEKVRGSNKAFRRFVELIGEKGEAIEDKILGIAHCNCMEKAISLREEILKRYKFKDIVIVEMGPTISAYADEGGILIAF